MTRIAIYCRISNDSSGRAAGVRRQEKECRELAGRLGWDVAAVHTDNDVHANARKRPQFDALAGGLERGDYDAVIAWKDDRLLRGGRSKRAHDFLTLVAARRTTVKFVQGDDWDFRTAQGRLMVEIRLGIAGYEIEQASERQQARWRQRKEDGRESNLGRRPFGFDRVGNKGERRLKVNRAEAKAVRGAARKLIAGKSLYRVAREMPLPPPYAAAWRPNHLRRMFEKDLFARHGVLTADEDRLVKARLAAAPKNPPGRPRRTYALSGLAVCGLCGQKLAASSGQFHCQPPGCGRLGIKADLVDRTVADQLTDHLPPEDELRDAPEKLNEDEAAALRELADIEDRIEKLADDLDMDEAVLRRRTRALTARRDELTETLGRPQTTPRIAWDWIARWAETGNPLTGEDREFLRTLIERVVVQPAAKRGSKKFDPSRVKITWR